jgi:hypothetical protein
MERGSFVTRKYYRSFGIYKLVLVPGFDFKRGTYRNRSSVSS